MSHGGARRLDHVLKIVGRQDRSQGLIGFRAVQREVREFRYPLEFGFHQLARMARGIFVAIGKDDDES